MSRLGQCFESLRADGRKGLITFITAGDPDGVATVPLMQALVRGGADVIELGVPFSDPMADGPVIQKASERALAAGATLALVLDCVQHFRQSDPDTPVVLMGYLNPFERAGFTPFAERAAKAGVDGVLVVDLPPEEAREFHDALDASGLDQVFLVAPNSSAERVARICGYASGFVYYVSVKGVTGDKQLDVGDVGARIAATRVAAPVPVGIGFGIKTPRAAAEAARLADAVIVGSALVELIEACGSDLAQARVRLQDFVAQLRAAVDAEATVA